MNLISVPAVTAAARELMPPGALPDPAEARALVHDLREAAETSTDLVLDAMRLAPAVEDAARARLAAGETRVVDRLGWVQANAETFASLLSGAQSGESGGARERGTARGGVPTPGGTAGTGPSGSRGTGPEGSRGTVPQGSRGTVPQGSRGPGMLRRLRDRSARTTASVELGGALALVGSRVLGQFDPFAGEAGVLYLVAPSVWEVEHALDVPPRDFRLWVALHERTHHVQFAAAPWLADHLRSRIDGLLNPLLGAEAGDEFLDSLRALPDALREGESLLDAVVGPEQAAAVEEIGALMSLLEGHADVLMDTVGRKVIPRVGRIRRAFDARRRSATGIRAIVSTLLGIDEKIAQYARGAAFVRAVVRDRGHDGLAAVWEAPELLPSAAEIAEPALWLARVPRPGDA